LPKLGKSPILSNKPDIRVYSLSLQKSPTERVTKPKGKSKTDKLIREKLDEEIFGRVGKNVKWVEVLHDIARRSLEENAALRNKDQEHNDAYKREFAFLLERIRSAEHCFSVVFTPILIGLYPHKYELTELYGKYIVASYDLAKLSGTSQLVTEQLWEETLPEGTDQGDSVDSGKRVIETLSSQSESDDEFLMSVRHLHLAITNFCTNVDQLKERFKEDSEIKELIGLLRPRIEQIEDASSILYSYAREKVGKRASKGQERIRGHEDLESKDDSSPVIADSNAPSSMPGLPSKTRTARTTKKWKWEGRVYLGSIAVKQADRQKKPQDPTPPKDESSS
jgi:hypothetical protein